MEDDHIFRKVLFINLTVPNQAFHAGNSKLDACERKSTF